MNETNIVVIYSKNNDKLKYYEINTCNSKINDNR